MRAAVGHEPEVGIDPRGARIRPAIPVSLRPPGRCLLARFALLDVTPWQRPRGVPPIEPADEGCGRGLAVPVEDEFACASSPRCGVFRADIRRQGTGWPLTGVFDEDAAMR